MIGKLYSKNLNNIDEIQLPLEILKNPKIYIGIFIID